MTAPLRRAHLWTWVVLATAMVVLIASALVRKTECNYEQRWYSLGGPTMSAGYRAVLWNRQKRIYDAVLAGGIALYCGTFIGVGAILHPNATAETLIIRALGTCAFLLLHIILCIGPLARLDRRFLPMLYNRRHLGVTMFLLALGHGVSH